MKNLVIPMKNTLSSTLIILGLFRGVAVAETQLPEFNAANFSSSPTVTNKYFPLEPGKKWRLVADTHAVGKADVVSSSLTVLSSGPRILGVQTIAVLDRDFENDRLVEETRDFFAQDGKGNVWYFGETVTNFEYDDAGNLVSSNNDSAWIAGRDGALPGQIMLAEPVVGASYFQEFAKAAQALDEGEIHAVGAAIEIDGQQFNDVLIVLETTSLEPEEREFKYYAAGIGLVRIEEDLDANLSNPKLIFNLVR